MTSIATRWLWLPILIPLFGLATCYGLFHMFCVAANGMTKTNAVPLPFPFDDFRSLLPYKP